MQNIGGEEKKEIDWGCELPKSEPIPTPELQKFIDMELFRMEAAKDILCAILANGGQTDDNDNSFATSDECITFAVRMADKLIAKLKHNEQLG